MCLRRLLCRWAQDVTHKVLPLWRYLLLPALGGYIHEDRLHSCGGNGQFSFHCVLEGEAAEQKQPSFTSTPRFSRETGPWCSCSFCTSSACSYLEGVPSTYRHQEIFLPLKPSSRVCTGIHAELCFSTFRLNMLCLCSPKSTWTLDAYVVQKNSIEFLSHNLAWRHGCRSCCSQQEMHGKSLRTVFNLSLWICSKNSLKQDKRLPLFRHKWLLERRPEKVKPTCPNATSKYQAHHLISTMELPQQAALVFARFILHITLQN